MNVQHHYADACARADGGTHVADTREVGGSEVTDCASKGRIKERIRIELAAGLA